MFEDLLYFVRRGSGRRERNDLEFVRRYVSGVESAGGIQESVGSALGAFEDFERTFILGMELGSARLRVEHDVRSVREALIEDLVRLLKHDDRLLGGLGSLLEDERIDQLRHGLDARLKLFFSQRLRGDSIISLEWVMSSGKHETERG